MKKPINGKFLIVDDHEIVRAGIKLLLESIYQPTEIHESRDGESTLRLIDANRYELIILDVQMPNTDTFLLMEYIHSRYPETRVLIFSIGVEHIYAKRFLRAGAMGFVSKDSPLEELTRAINLVLSNRKYISEYLLDILAEEAGPATTVNPFDRLSPREMEIVSLLLAGHTRTTISKMLKLESSTVGTYKARIFDKLGVKNILELKEMYDSFNTRRANEDQVLSFGVPVEEGENLYNAMLPNRGTGFQARF
jgi:two-component system invasion response regulator UvrY